MTIEVARLCDQVFALHQDSDEGPQCVIATEHQVLGLLSQLRPEAIAEWLRRGEHLHSIEKNTPEAPEGTQGVVVSLLPRRAQAA
jgi:hypothetical protein